MSSENTEGNFSIVPLVQSGFKSHQIKFSNIEVHSANMNNPICFNFIAAKCNGYLILKFTSLNYGIYSLCVFLQTTYFLLFSQPKKQHFKKKVFGVKTQYRMGTSESRARSKQKKSIASTFNCVSTNRLCQCQIKLEQGT